MFLVCVLLFVSCLFINSISLQLQPIREDGVKIGLKNYEIIDAYFQQAMKLAVYDFTDEDNEFVTDLLKSAFDDYFVTVTYSRPNLNLESPRKRLISKRNSLEFVFRDYNYDKDDFPHYCIPDKAQEGVIIFHDSNIEELFIFININYKMIIERSLMTVFVGECGNNATALFSEILNHVHRHFQIPYHLALMLRCSVLTFFDLLEYNTETESWGNLIWLDLNKINDTRSVVSPKLDGYKGFPLNIAMFERPPTSIHVQDIKMRKRYPTYLKNMLHKTNWTGIDHIVLYHVKEKLNFSVRVKYFPKHDFGFKAENGTFVGTLGAVINEDVDISFNGRFVKDYETSGILGFLHYVSFDRVCFITPKAQQIPTWMAPLLIFQINTWAAFFALVWVNGLFWYVLRQLFGDSHEIIQRGKLKLKFEGRDGFPALFLDSATMLLSNIRDKLPSNIPERMFLATILFSATYMSGVIQAALSSSFSTVSFFKEIETYEDLLKAGLPIQTSRSVGDLLGNESDTRKVIRQLQKQLKYFEKSVPSIPHAATYRNVCGVEREADAEILIKSMYSTPLGEPLVQVMNECPRVYYLSYITRINWPFSPDINRVISYFYESGLIKKWYNDVKHTLQNESIPVDMIQYSPFTVNNLVFSFYLLFCGLIAAIFIFIAELIFGRKLSLKVKKKKRLVKLIKMKTINNRNQRK